MDRSFYHLSFYHLSTELPIYPSVDRPSYLTIAEPVCVNPEQRAEPREFRASEGLEGALGAVEPAVPLQAHFYYL